MCGKRRRDADCTAHCTAVCACSPLAPDLVPARYSYKRTALSTASSNHIHLDVPPGPSLVLTCTRPEHNNTSAHTMSDDACPGNADGENVGSESFFGSTLMQRAPRLGALQREPHPLSLCFLLAHQVMPATVGLRDVLHLVEMAGKTAARFCDEPHVQSRKVSGA
jgi:hypothetical protein